MYATESLGVGVSVPTSNLEVVGNAYVSSNLDVGGSLGLTKGSSLFAGDSVVMETPKHDRPLTRYPELPLTSAANAAYYKGYKVTMSDQASLYRAWDAFDHLGGGDVGWYTGGGGVYNGTNGAFIGTARLASETALGEWIGLEVPSPVKLNRVRIYSQSFSPSVNTIDEFFIYAKKASGDTWTDLGEFTGIAAQQGSGGVTVTVNSTDIYYKFFALVATKRYAADPNSGVAIRGLDFFGTEEGDVSTDVTLSSMYNKPGTEQLEVYWDGADSSSYSGSGTMVNDLSGNGVTGTLANGVGFDSEYNAFTFDGTDDYILTDVTNPAGAYVHSVSTWVKADRIGPDTNDNITQIGSPGSDAHTKRLQFCINGTDGGLRMGLSGSSVIFDANLQVGIWYHLVYTYDGGAAGNGSSAYKVYVDGVSIPGIGGSGSGVLNLDANSKFAVAGHHLGTTGFHFDGSIANVRLFAKVLSIDQIKELYDYQKDYFLGSRSSMTLYKGNLGLGVAEPTSRLEIAGNEQLQEYPPRAMTGNDTYMEGHGVFRATASSEYNSTFKAFRAFIENIDNSTSSFWHSQSTYSTASGYNPHTGNQSITAGDGAVYSGEWIQLSMPYQIHLKRIGVSPRTTNYNRGPHTATLLARRNGGDDWVVLTSWGGLVWTTTEASDAVIKYIEVNSEQPYSEFVMVVHLSNDSVNINRMKFFGTPAPSTLDDGKLTLGKQLTTPRVSGHAVGAETPRAESLVVHYDTTVDSVASGSTAVDTSGSGNNGTFNGNAVYSSADRTFQFDGTGDYIVKTSASGLPTGDAIFSVSAWINILPVASWPSGAQWPNIITYGSAWAGSKLAGFFVDANLALNGTVGSSSSKTASGTITPNTWQHVVAVKSGTGQISTTTYELYVDGVKLPITGVSGTNTLSIDSGVSVSIGGGFTGVASDMFTGKISNPKMWNVALTADEVAADYALGRTGKALNVTDTAVCLGGTAPRAQLDVRGSMIIDGIIKHSAWPAFRVTTNNGENIFSNHSGGTNAKSSGHNNNTNSSDEVIPWKNVVYDNTGSYTYSGAGDYKFTAPVSGIYHFHFHCLFTRSSTSSSRLDLKFFVNGGLNAHLEMNGDFSSSTNYNVGRGHTTNLHLNAGNFVQAVFTGVGDAWGVYNGGAQYFNVFSGQLIAAD
jgi:hypothetical protein